MGERKAKAIQTNLGTFRHNQIYPGIIQAYLEPCFTLTHLKLWYIQIPNILRTIEAYSETRHIQNRAIFRTLAIFKI